MSFRADFKAYVFDPSGTKEEHTCSGGGDIGSRVTGSVTYAISSKVGTTGYLEQWKDPGKRSFMLGLYIDATQSVEVDYEDENGGDLRLTENAGVAAQLASAFGQGTNKKWVGLVHPGGAGAPWKLDTSNAGFVSFKVRVGISPADGPQFIPVVARHRNNVDDQTGQIISPGDFKDGYIAGVWYVPKVYVSAGRRRVCGPRGLEWLDK
jgi:hypothetical protein